ncbi:YrhB domain-containing protein [Rhizobium sp. CF080]|uniref:YrhB domain-containing protein n=1 Tax=Rhizobium sp. (strain CF080) TaxID=1144310 RepID=UPI000569CBD9|nr:YrhB domain-containing protein [Rhizobium sp. CF080]
MKKIGFEEAETLAKSRIKELEKSVGCDLSITLENTKYLSNGWIFFYNSTSFVETGEIRWALGGNGPIFISEDGALFELRSDLPWQEALKQVKAN